MSLSYFDSAKLEPHALGKAGVQQITAKGPLTDVPPDKYIPPYTIHVTIMQNPPNDHEPENARRAVGFTTMNGPGDWTATLEVPVDEFDMTREARGIGVMGLARTEGYTSEVLTWCDHLQRLDGITKEEAKEERRRAAEAAEAAAAGK